MVSGAKTVDEFLDGLPADERAVFAELRALLKKTGPKIEESMKYRMPTCMIGEATVGAFNKQKKHLCLYLTPVAVDPYRKELKAAGLDCGRSCLRFTRPGQLPLDLVTRMIKSALKLAR
jgi:uncharacterized protein YdhG (YjbR/CyaY superfamily)